MKRTRWKPRRLVVPDHVHLKWLGVLGGLAFVVQLYRHRSPTALGALLFWLGLIALFGLLRLWDRRRSRQVQATDHLRNGLEPYCVCPECRGRAAVQRVCPACRQEVFPSPLAVKVIPRDDCPHCRTLVSSRKEFRRLGLKFRCARTGQCGEVHPTWVVGVPLRKDFRMLSNLPGMLPLRRDGIDFLMLPPAAGEELAPCFVDLSALPEQGTLAEEHPVAALKAIWFSAAADRLEMGRALDRFILLSGLTAIERREIQLLCEAQELDAAQEKLLAGRMGAVRTAVSPEHLRHAGGPPLPTAVPAHPLQSPEPMTVGRGS